MIEISHVDNEHIPTEKKVKNIVSYFTNSTYTDLLNNLLICKENAQKAVDINIKTKCVAIESGIAPPQQLVELSTANELIDECISKCIFQILRIDVRTPNKYNKVAALLEEFNVHGTNKIFETLIELSLISGDIKPEGEEE